MGIKADEIHGVRSALRAAFQPITSTMADAFDFLRGAPPREEEKPETAADRAIASITEAAGQLQGAAAAAKAQHEASRDNLDATFRRLAEISNGRP